MKNQNLIINILKGGLMSQEKKEDAEKICCKCLMPATNVIKNDLYCRKHYNHHLKFENFKGQWEKACAENPLPEFGPQPQKNDGPEKICCKCTRRADHFWEEESYCNTHWADKLASLIAKGLTPWQKESEKQKDMDSFIKEHLAFLNDKNTQFYQYEPKNKIPTVSESSLYHGSDYRYCIRCGIMIGPIENHPEKNTLCVSCWKYTHIQDAFNRIRTSVPPEIESKLNHDPVNHPKHYTKNGIEVIDFIEAYELGFRLGNAVKYIARAGEKDPAKRIEDLKKARWYLDREIVKHDSK